MPALVVSVAVLRTAEYCRMCAETHEEINAWCQYEASVTHGYKESPTACITVEETINRSVTTDFLQQKIDTVQF